MDCASVLNTFIQYSFNTFLWVIFLVVILWICRVEFKNFLNSFINIWNKAKKVELFGVNLHFGSEILPLAGQSNNRIDYTAYQSPAVNNEAELIRKQISDNKIPQEQAVNLLITQLALANFLVAMNVVDKHIYEEQIELLIFLNKNRLPYPECDLHTFFEKWQKKNVNIQCQFSDFIDFLLTKNGLIMQTVRGYTISQLGIEYLSFIVRIGRPSPPEKKLSNEI